MYVCSSQDEETVGLSGASFWVRGRLPAQRYLPIRRRRWDVPERATACRGFEVRETADIDLMLGVISSIVLVFLFL